MNKTNYKNSEYVIVYRLDFAMQLMEKGFECITTMPNPVKPNLIMWAFRRSVELERELSLLKGGRRNESRR